MAVSALLKLLVAVSGNGAVQQFLHRNVRVSHYLMGIGSGAAVSSSGEAAVFDVLRRTCPSPYCVFDVGANQGQFLGLTLGQPGSSAWTVHCFEPAAGTFELLARAWGADVRVQLNRCAIGREPGSARLFFDRVGSGLSSLTRRRLDHFGISFDQSEEVAVTTVDRYCAERGIDRINLLKIDVEGHELDVLSGANGLLEKRGIDVVMFEFGGCNIDTRTFFQDFWYLFSAAGMSLFRITPSGYLWPVRAYDEMHEQFRTMNYIAVLDAPVAGRAARTR